MKNILKHTRPSKLLFPNLRISCRQSPLTSPSPSRKSNSADVQDELLSTRQTMGLYRWPLGGAKKPSPDADPSEVSVRVAGRQANRCAPCCLTSPADRTRFFFKSRRKSRPVCELHFKLNWYVDRLAPRMRSEWQQQSRTCPLKNWEERARRRSRETVAFRGTLWRFKAECKAAAALRLT